MSGSSSVCGSPTEPRAGDLLSKFANTLASVDIIASNNIVEVSRAGLWIRIERINRRPAYRRAREEARSHWSVVNAGSREADKVIVPGV